MLVNKLKTLHNTLCLVETKGNNTVIMGDCLRFLSECIQEIEQTPTEPEEIKPLAE